MINITIIIIIIMIIIINRFPLTTNQETFIITSWPKFGMLHVVDHGMCTMSLPEQCASESYSAATWRNYDTLHLTLSHLEGTLGLTLMSTPLSLKFICRNSWLEGVAIRGLNNSSWCVLFFSYYSFVNYCNQWGMFKIVRACVHTKCKSIKMHGPFTIPIFKSQLL